MNEIGASCVKWLPNTRFNQGDRILMRDGTVWACAAPGISSSNWREEAFQIPDGSIVDGSVIWRNAERTEENEDNNAPKMESWNSEELEEIIEVALAEGLRADDTGDAYIVLIEDVTSANNE